MSMHWWQNVDAQSVPMQRLNEQFINQIQWVTFKILSIHSQDILYAAIISWETVLGLGRDIPGHPAFIIISKWWSLTILCGWLFSAHHLAIWALKFKFHKLLQKERVWLKYSPNFFSSMSTMWYFDGLLALVSKCCKYRSILTFRSFIFKCGLDQILTKASKCMTLEIECCSMILWVQVALNTFMTLSLAVLGSRLKKVKLSPFIIPNRNFCFEKPVNGGTPADLKTFYNHMVRNKKYMESKIVCTKFLLIGFSIILLTRR